MWAGRTYPPRGGQADGNDQQQDKGQGLAKSQLPRDTETNKPRQLLGDITHHIPMHNRRGKDVHVVADVFEQEKGRTKEDRERKTEADTSNRRGL